MFKNDKNNVALYAAYNVLLFSGILILIAAIVSGQLFKNEINIIAAASKGDRIIIVDAGHGGEDCGAIGVNGKLEKELNLEISTMLGEALSNAGFTVVYTRTEDKMLYSEDENIKGMRKISDLKNRVKVAETYLEALFISIHMNSYHESKYSGFQAYYLSANKAGEDLAEAIQTSVRDKIQPNNSRKTKGSDKIYVLTNSPVTSVLLECGFITNSEECEKLCQKEYQKQLSFAIVCGIIEYIENSI